MTQIKADRVVYAHNNSEAARRLNEDAFNLIIIGSEFPDLGGIDFSRYIRLGDGSAAEAPIIMLMYEPSRKKVLAAIDAGINEIIIPPFSVSKIKEHIDHIITHPRPFIRTDNYSGPVRRGTDDMNYVSA